MNRADVNHRLKDFQEECRARGLSVTYQRLAIYRALLQLEGHPSPDDVYQVVKKAYPSISLATIYKTLERLERAGLIAKPNLIHETARYEHRTQHHHHVVCTGCKRLEDVAADTLRTRLPRDPHEIGLPEVVRREYEIADYTITFKGLCKSCKKAMKGAPVGAAATAAAESDED